MTNPRGATSMSERNSQGRSERNKGNNRRK